MSSSNASRAAMGPIAHPAPKAEPSAVCRIDFEADGYHVDDVAITGDLIRMFRLGCMDRDQFWGAIYFRDGRDLRFSFDGSKARSLKVTAEWEGRLRASPASPESGQVQTLDEPIPPNPLTTDGAGE